MFPAGSRLIFAVFLLLIPASLHATDPAKPNILIIVADDLGWGDVGWHDGPFQTPRLDSLCREGVELDQYHVSPMCSPTRTALLSGRYASRFGCTSAQNPRVLPFGTETLATALRSTGYETALVGKWHLGSEPEWGPQHFGFDHSYGSMAGGCGPYDHRYKQGPHTHTWHRDGTRISEEGHVTDLIASDAVRWMEARGERPFLLYVPFTAVHIPIKEPQVWLDRYAAIQEEDRREYAACVTHLDDAVGRIVAALDRTGKRENTLILFFSDNGGTQARNDDPSYPDGSYTPGRAHGDNRPLRGNKGQLYQGGIRVPAFIHWKGRLEPGKFTAPLHAADWMPTFCSLAGHQPASDLHWDGQNIWPWLTAAKQSEPRTLYWAGTGFRTAAVRHGDWKLFVDRQQNRFELLNLAADPYEEHDLSAAEPARLGEMQALLERMSMADVTERPADP